LILKVESSVVGRLLLILPGAKLKSNLDQTVNHEFLEEVDCKDNNDRRKIETAKTEWKPSPNGV